MLISVISVFPKLYDQFLSTSLIGNAVKKGIVSFNLIKFSDLVEKTKRIDIHTVGPGHGMIIKPSVVESAVNFAKERFGEGKIIFFCPQGKKLDQLVFTSFYNNEVKNVELNTDHDDSSEKKTPHIILICARYEGIDERVKEEYADYIFSIGDYVVMGGDLPAQIFIEGLLRLIPGVVGNKNSVSSDSFSDCFLDYPEYGKPIEWKKRPVPNVLVSGNHKDIADWRKKKSFEKTIEKRFDWLKKNISKKEDILLVKELIPSHYVVLMHSDVIIKGKGTGNSSIASLNIHDIARSSKTYGIENYLIVSLLKDQQKIVEFFMDFWKSSEGKEYNYSRYEAVSLMQMKNSLDEVVSFVTSKEEKKPLLIATSAREHQIVPVISYDDQEIVWSKKRPVIFIFGTAQGLSDNVLAQCDFILSPLRGLSNYNHLSVRSAVAIVLDRWLGIK